MLVLIFCTFFVEASITDELVARVNEVLVEKVDVDSSVCGETPNCDCLEGSSFYCDNGTLVEDCFKCGCPAGYACEPENRTCVLEGAFKIEQDTGFEEQVILDRLVDKEDVDLNPIRLIPVSFLGSNNIVINFDGLKVTFSLDLFGKPKVEFDLKENS